MSGEEWNMRSHMRAQNGRSRQFFHLLSIRRNMPLNILKFRSFLSTLIPSTPEMLQHILIQGGIDSAIASSPDPIFLSLLEETRGIVSSPCFGSILEGCLDSATDYLMEGLRTSVFSPPLPLPTAPFSGAAESESHHQSEGMATGEITSIRVKEGDIVELRSQDTKVLLAGMLPGFARWCRTALDGVPNTLVDVRIFMFDITSLSPYFSVIGTNES